MAVKNPKELFLMMLSQVRQGTERSTNIYRELGEAAQNPEIKQAFEARAFVNRQNLEKIDEAFKLLGEKPVQLWPATRSVCGGFQTRTCGDAIARGEKAVCSGQGEPPGAPEDRGICGAGCGSRHFRKSRRGRAARELPGRSSRVRGEDQAMDSKHR